MYRLASDELQVDVLDPEGDRERFGVRYCTGGYIFQVSDVERGPLLSGPTYGDGFNWFDGQGIPDSFSQNPLRDPQDATGPALVIGIGVCDLSERAVQEFSRWEVTAGPDQTHMKTAQAFGPYALELERTVRVHGRSVASHVRLANRGGAPIPLRWFPHPFFPHPDTDELCWFNAPVQIDGDNPGYELADNGFIRRKGWPWTQEGQYLALDHEARNDLVVLQRHPVVSMIAANCSYAPASFPIWGNGRTFSWEPYLERTVAGRQSLEWQISYHF